MDLNAIKQKLDSLNKQSNYKKGSGKNLFWKPSVGKQVVRVVPNKYNKDFPFTEMMFYYGIGQRVMASPKNKTPHTVPNIGTEYVTLDEAVGPKNFNT